MFSSAHVAWLLTRILLPCVIFLYCFSPLSFLPLNCPFPLLGNVLAFLFTAFTDWASFVTLKSPWCSWKLTPLTMPSHMPFWMLDPSLLASCAAKLQSTVHLQTDLSMPFLDMDQNTISWQLSQSHRIIRHILSFLLVTFFQMKSLRNHHRFWFVVS